MFLEYHRRSEYQHSFQRSRYREFDDARVERHVSDRVFRIIGVFAWIRLARRSATDHTLFTEISCMSLSVLQIQWNFADSIGQLLHLH